MTSERDIAGAVFDAAALHPMLEMDPLEAFSTRTQHPHISALRNVTTALLNQIEPSYPGAFNPLNGLQRIRNLDSQTTLSNKIAAAAQEARF